MVCIVLRIIEGVATALFTTAGYTLLTELYPDSTGFIVVYNWSICLMCVIIDIISGAS